jgi:AraC-like DNA-binding protein
MTTIDQTIWRVATFGDNYVAPHDSWHHDNRQRTPANMVVFQYVLAGRMVYEDATGKFPVEPNAAALFRHGEQSAYGVARDSVARFQTMWIGFYGAGLIQQTDALRAEYGSIFRFGRDTTIRDLMRQLMALADPHARNDPLVIADAVHHLFTRLIHHARQARRSTLTPVERAIDDLQRYPLTAWSMKALAQRHGVSREHITRVFTERFGQSPASYVAERRLARAMELLEQTSLPIVAVARQAGYGTTHSLARHVRKKTGQSPGLWRQAIQ